MTIKKGLQPQGTPSLRDSISKGLHPFFIILFSSLLAISALTGQGQSQSIHNQQSEYFSQFGPKPAAFYDSLSGFTGKMIISERSDCQLSRIIFGFHPYWAGSDYLNYQWNLISDLCYFAYEVEPLTGDPVTIHDWLTDPAIDSAQANGVRVHLCATIFSGHTAFFNNPAARQNLIDNLISLVQARNADGVNMDIEAVPSSVSDSMTTFMEDLSRQLKAAIPNAILSLDIPAIDWSGAFQADSLSDYLDWFFIMGYDYYWSGSDQAGPVSPLYTMVSDYNRSLARTISDWEREAVSPEKLILGVPYYGRQWKTESDAIPSPATGGSSAVLYSTVKNNGSIYNASSYAWEPNSYSSCYIFYQNNSWNQCFIGLERDLREKYDLVNYRDLAGIGIWALGYDNGYTELWQAISDKFTDCYIPLTYDTVFDSGGPTWNYYADEDYSMTIDQGFGDTRYLTFTSFGMEDTFDSLWVFGGPDTTYPRLGAYSGDINPGTLSSPNGAFTLKFRSDGIYNFSGWSAVFHDGSMDAEEIEQLHDKMQVFPNPVKDYVRIQSEKSYKIEGISIIDSYGRCNFRQDFCGTNKENEVELDVKNLPTGLYIIVIQDFMNNVKYSKLIICH